MAQPASSARALHGILADVNGRIADGQKTGHQAWVDVAGAQIESAEFIKFHTETQALLAEVLNALATLSPGSRSRFSRYVPAWWGALVQPSKSWGGDYAKIIDQPSLDMLDSLADVVEATAGPANPQVVEILRRSVDRMLVEVDATNDLLPAVRGQILADLNHIAAILSNVETFGVQHAVAEVEKVTGRVVAEAVRSPTRGLKKLAIELTVVLALLAPVTEHLDTIVGNVRSVFGIEASAEPGTDIVAGTVVEIYNVCARKALTAAPSAARELPPGDGADEPMGAEVIEEP